MEATLHTAVPFHPSSAQNPSLLQNVTNCAPPPFPAAIPLPIIATRELQNAVIEIFPNQALALLSNVLATYVASRTAIPGRH